MDDKEFRRTSQVVQIFQNGSGKLLQEELESRQKAQNTGNSMSDLQSWGIYLRSRLPIHPFGTFYGVNLLTERAHSQGEKAALIAEIAFAFKRGFEAIVSDRIILIGRFSSYFFQYLFNNYLIIYIF